MSIVGMITGIADRITIDRFDIGPKLILAFVLVAVLVGVTGVIGYQAVGTVDEEAHVIADDGEKMGAAAEMVAAIKHQRSAVQAAQLGESGAREEFDQARTSGGQFQSGWRVFLPDVDVSGLPESRAIRDALNALRRLLET